MSRRSFPFGEFRKLGYKHIAIHGQKGYHGVAIVSRLPLRGARAPGLLRQERRAPHRRDAVKDARTRRRHHPQFLCSRRRRHPRSRGEPEIRPQALVPRRDARLVRPRRPRRRPRRSWSATSTSRRWRTTSGATSRCSTSSRHTPIECEKLLGGAGLRRLGGRDPHAHARARARLHLVELPRRRSGRPSDRGRRLDHIWVVQGAAPAPVTASTILREARSWERPSDHVPVMHRPGVSERQARSGRSDGGEPRPRGLPPADGSNCLATAATIASRCEPSRPSLRIFLHARAGTRARVILSTLARLSHDGGGGPLRIDDQAPARR